MSYTTTPSNYSEIKSYISEYSEETVRCIINAKHCYIIDTCSIEFYKKENRVESFAEYVKQTNGTIIVFRTILMEMCGDRGALDRLHIDFFKCLYESGVKVFILYEENILGILNAYTQRSEIGRFLKNAVLCVKGPTGLLRNFLDANSDIMHKIVSPTVSFSEESFSQFWNELRGIKKHKDSLGEVVCAICIHMLANMEDMNKFKYIFTTEDKPSITILAKVINNQRKYNTTLNKDMIGVATSAKIVEEMFQKGILASKADIESFYKPFNDQTRIRATVKKKYDVQLSIISLTVSEFAEFIVENEGSVLC